MMKQIRIRINDLVDKHGPTFHICNGCSICEEIKQLREKLIRDPDEKFLRILAKGQDMTKSEIVLLIENDVNKKTIKKALGLNNYEFYEMMKNFGLSRDYNSERRKEMAIPLPITVDEFVQLHYVEGKKRSEICEIKKIKAAALSNWKWNHKVEIEEAVAALNLPKVEKKKSTIPEKPVEFPILESPATQEDIVNRPNHYHQNGIDVIGFSELQFEKSELKGFYRINVLKYVTRYDRKNGAEDLEKATFYLNKLRELEN